MRTQLKINEKEILMIRKHWIVLFDPIFWLLLSIIALISLEVSQSFVYLFVIGIFSIWFFFKIFVRKADIWVVTSLRIIDEHGVFSRNSKETPLEKINNVSYSQSLIGRLFDYGHIQIQSAAESGMTIHRFVERPKILKNTITQYQEYYKQEQIKQQANSITSSVTEQKPIDNFDITVELTKLHDLKQKGIITDEEFIHQKKKIFGI